MTETTFYIEEIDPIDDENDVETKGSDVIDLSPSPSLIDAAGQPEKVCWFQLQSKGVKPKARGGHSLTATGRGQILLFGGSTRTADFFNDTFVFDIASSSWKQLEVTGVAPPGRSGHSACFHDNKLFVFGGQKVTMAGSDMQFEFLSDLWSLDLATSTWKHVAVKGSKLPKRNGHSAHVVDNSLFIFFGSDEQGPHSDIWRVNLDTLECSRVITQGPEPEARELHGSLLTATGEGNLVIISGGRGVDGLFEDAFTFNCTSLTWSRYGDFPVRAAHAMFQAGDRFAAFGGMDPTGFCGDVLINVKHQTTAGNPKADRSNDSAMAAPPAESNDAKKKKKMTKKEKNLRAKQRNNWFRGAVESPSDDSSAASAIASLQISSSNADNAASSLKLEGLVSIGAPSARFAFGFASLSKDKAMVWGGMNEKGDLDDFLVVSVSCPQ